jgi:hypothetical protein
MQRNAERATTVFHFNEPVIRRAAMTATWSTRHNQPVCGFQKAATA